MNVNIYINDAIAKQLDLLAETTGKKRNTLIQEAITHLVKSQTIKVWPSNILEFKGIGDSHNFMALRFLEKS